MHSTFVRTGMSVPISVMGHPSHTPTKPGSHASRHPSIALGIITKCLFAQCVCLRIRIPPQYSGLPYQHVIIHYASDSSGDNAGKHQTNVIGAFIPVLAKSHQFKDASVSFT